MPGDYSLSDVLERMYTNQLALEAALMELTLHVEQKGVPEVGSNIRGALGTIGENAGHIKQGLARFRGSEVQRFRGSEVQRFRGSEVQRFRGSEVQRFRGRLEMSHFGPVHN